jgi:thioredoxin reductase (NADPH)
MTVPLHHAPLLIVGSGPAGYTAAIYGARALLRPILVSGLEEGGQLMVTTDVENYPGFADVIQGPWLMQQMRLQAAHVGTKLVSDHIVEADLHARPFRLKGDSGDLYTGDALVIATGARAKWLGLPSEERFRGFGVSACATCDGFFFRGKEVVVVGGGNTAVEEALYLANLASKVTLVHRRDSFRAERILQERLFGRANIDVVFEHVLHEVTGVDKPLAVKGVTLRHVRTGALTRMATDGVFIAIGHAPAVELFKDQLRMTPSGYIATEPGSTVTSSPGVFAAGDVTDERYRQAVTAAGLGCMAALDAEKWLMATQQQRAAAE